MHSTAVPQPLHREIQSSPYSLKKLIEVGITSWLNENVTQRAAFEPTTFDFASLRSRSHWTPRHQNSSYLIVRHCLIFSSSINPWLNFRNPRLQTGGQVIETWATCGPRWAVVPLNKPALGSHSSPDRSLEIYSADTQLLSKWLPGFAFDRNMNRRILKIAARLKRLCSCQL